MPALVHERVDLVGTVGRLLEPMAVLELEEEEADVDALIGPTAVRGGLPAHDAEAPHVRLLVELAVRGRIGRIPLERPLALRARLVVVILAEAARHAEVAHLGHLLARQEHVARRQVAVHQALARQVPHGVRHLAAHAHYLPHAHLVASRAQVLVKRAEFGELEDEHECSATLLVVVVVVLAHADEADDVRVAQRGHELGLLGDLLLALLRVHVELLDCDGQLVLLLLFRGLFVDAAKDGAEAAAAQLVVAHEVVDVDGGAQAAEWSCFST